MADAPQPAPDQTAALAALWLECCVALGVTDFVIAPGSRSAPLTAALARDGRVRKQLVYDERAAGYVALGLAQQLQRPVGVVCTSGTAAVNLAPAVVEAFYQQIPLLIFSADRPPEWIDQEDNQAIRQSGLYGAHVRGTLSLALSEQHADAAWQVRRTLADAVQLATAQPNGPVQINMPLREPLYGAPPAGARPPVQPAQLVATTAHVTAAAWPALLAQWQQARRKLIVAGLHPVDPALAAALAELAAADESVAIIGDVTSNLLPQVAPLRHWDSVLATRDGALLDALAPELVVTVGGQLTSKALKSFLRTRPPQALWRVAPSLPAADTYQCLSHVLPVAAAPFFAELGERTGGGAQPQSGYAKNWQRANSVSARLRDNALASLPWCELTAVERLLSALPPDSALQLGNSLPIRYVNLLGFDPNKLPTSVHANRGTSGIDGVVSTAVGAAFAGDGLTTLIVSDLSFFYDRNGLWLRSLPPNLRIVLLNNHGGGIFDVIAGPDQLDADLRRDYFLTPQPLNARRTAEDAGLRYTHIAGADALAAALPAFFAPESGAALLEIETEMATNSAAFRSFVRATAALRRSDLTNIPSPPIQGATP